MSINKLMTGMAAVLALAGTALATPHAYRSVAAGSWDQAKNWEYWTGSAWVNANGILPAPGSGDTVTIVSSFPIAVDAANAAVASLTVDASAALTINSTYSLTVDSGGSAAIDGTMTVLGAFYSPASGISVGGTVFIDSGLFSASGNTYLGSGTHMVMRGTSPTLQLNNTSAVVLNSSSAVLLVESSAYFTGSGELRGNFDAASIQIGTPSGSTAVTLNNYAIIAGGLTIKRNVSNASAVPNLANTSTGGQPGLVMADNGGTILLASTLNAISDDSNDACGIGNSHWEAKASSVLQFDKPATSLVGDFYVAGTLQINQNVTTSGSLKFASGGNVTVANAKAFTFSGGYCAGSTCSGTASPFNGPTTVSCP